MKNFKNNILIKNIIILLLSGGISKLIGMIGKIIYTKQAGIEVVGLYTLITPTFMLIMTLCQFSLPISVSKLSAEEKYNNKELLFNSYYIGMIINLILMFLILIFSKTISSLLHNSIIYKAIISIIFIIPFVMVTSIQRGFLHGKENMIGSSLTNIIEEIIKIILIITTLPIAIAKSNITAVITIILYNVITELSSIVIMNKYVKKYIDNKKVKINKNIIRDILKISLPTTLIRLISSIAFFLEPIILTNVLLKDNYSIKYITLQYGIINSYVIPLLSMPSFFSISISSALLPNLTKLYTNKKYKNFKDKLYKLLLISLLIGIFCITFILIFPKYILNLIYGVTFGINYIKILAPFFILIFIQPTLSITLQAIGKTNKLFFVTIISNLLKYISLFLLGTLGFGILSLNIATIIGIITTTSLVSIIVLKELKKLLK